MSQTQHLITQIQQICQDICDIKQRKPFHYSKSLIPSPSPQQIKPEAEKLSSLQRGMETPNSIVPEQSQKLQDQTKHPNPKTPIFEKSVHINGTTSTINLKTMKPILGAPNHPTEIFSGFMDKEWEEIHTERGKGGHDGKSDQQFPCHMIQETEPGMTQEVEAGMSQYDSV